MVRQMLNIRRIIKPNFTCAISQAWGKVEFHGPVYELGQNRDDKQGP